MVRFVTRAAMAALGFMALTAPAAAAHYVVSSYGERSWTPIKFPGTVTYQDTLSGSFDTDDTVPTINLQSGLTSVAFTVSRETIMQPFMAPAMSSTATYQIGLGDLKYFSYDLSDPSILYFSGATGGMSATASSNNFIFGKTFNEPSSYGPLTVTLAAVPEPASWAMMVAGFGLVGWAIRGRARRGRALPA